MSQGLVEYVNSKKEMFLPKLVDDSIKWEREAQFCIQAVQNNSYLERIAMSNPQSFENAIINIAALGISLNPAEKRAYLVPRDGKVCLDVSYMGLMFLATSEGSIVWGQAKIVYANDTYENQGLTKEPKHKYMAFGDRGEAVGCYCTVKLPNGDFMTEEMSGDDIRNIRDRSAGFKSGKNTPWKTDELEMWRKTVVKRASKYWPQPAKSRLNETINMLNEVNGEGLEKEVTCTPEQQEQLLEICQSMGKEFDEALKTINASREEPFEKISDVTQSVMSNFLEWANKMLEYYNKYSSMLSAYGDGSDPDEFYIYECIEELTIDDQKFVWKAYTKFGFIKGDIQRDLRAIHQKVKAEQHQLNN